MPLYPGIAHFPDISANPLCRSWFFATSTLSPVTQCEKAISCSVNELLALQYCFPTPLILWLFPFRGHFTVARTTDGQLWTWVPGLPTWPWLQTNTKAKEEGLWPWVKAQWNKKADYALVFKAAGETRAPWNGGRGQKKTQILASRTVKVFNGMTLVLLVGWCTPIFNTLGHRTYPKRQTHSSCFILQ